MNEATFVCVAQIHTRKQTQKMYFKLSKRYNETIPNGITIRIKRNANVNETSFLNCFQPHQF